MKLDAGRGRATGSRIAGPREEPPWESRCARSRSVWRRPPRCSPRGPRGTLEPPSPALAKALGDPQDRVRAEAAYALGRIGSGWPEAAAALAKALGDGEERVRKAAAWASGQIGSDAKAAVPKLIESLKDPDADIRRTAA